LYYQHEELLVIEPKPALQSLGFLSFSIALFLGMLLTLARVWPDSEATMYGFVKYGHPRITSFKCPPLMTSSDHDSVTLKLQNNLDKPITWYVNAQITSDVLINSFNDTLQLQPGESRLLSWQIDSTNITLGNFILAHIFTSAAMANGMREATCGTFVLKLPFTGGTTVYYTASGLTAVGLGLGLWLWRRHTRLSESHLVSQFNWMRFVAVLTAVSIVVSYEGLWFPALLCLLLILLATSVFLIPRKI